MWAAVSHGGTRWPVRRQPRDTTFAGKVKGGVAAVNTSRQPFPVQFEELRITPGRQGAAKPEAP